MTGIVTDIGLITGRRCKTTGGWRLNQLSLFEGWGWWCLMKYIGTHIHSPIQGEFAAWMESGLRFGYSGCGFGFCNAGFYFSQQTVAAGWRCWLWKNQRAEMIRWKHWGRFYCICFYLNMQIKWYAFKMFGLKTPPPSLNVFHIPPLPRFHQICFRVWLRSCFFLQTKLIERKGPENWWNHVVLCSLLSVFGLVAFSQGHTIHSYRQCLSRPKAHSLQLTKKYIESTVMKESRYFPHHYFHHIFPSSPIRSPHQHFHCLPFLLNIPLDASVGLKEGGQNTSKSLVFGKISNSDFLSHCSGMESDSF